MEQYSVLMSLYKKEKPEYLKQSIESMLNQTVKSNQIVIVEDGPLTNELNDVVKKYKEQYGNLFYIIHSKKNIGLGLALNLGLKHCKNDLVARMDTDDISKADRCEKQLKVFAEDKEVGIVGCLIDEFCGNINNIISTRRVPENFKDIYFFSKRRSAFNHPTVMYKKSLVLQFGGYSDLRRNQDIDLFGRMVFGGCRAKNIQESLLYFRSSDSLAKRRKSWENTWSYVLTIKKFWNMGYSSFFDLCIVSIAQIGMFLCPIKLQFFLYKKILRK